MALTILYIGKEEVLEAFEKRAKKAYWAVFDKGINLYQYEDNDFEQSKEVLSEFLDLCIKRNYANPLTLKFCSESEEAYNAKSKSYGNFTFQCSASAPAPTYVGADLQTFYINEINALKAEINAMKMKWDPIEEEEDEEEEEESDSMRLLSGVNTLLDHPLIAGLVARFTTGQQQPRTLAGVDNVDEYLQILYKKGLTPDHLRKLSEMPESKIKMLLTML
jgi:hypothetical protein